MRFATDLLLPIPLAFPLYLERLAKPCACYARNLEAARAAGDQALRELAYEAGRALGVVSVGDSEGVFGAQPSVSFGWPALVPRT